VDLGFVDLGETVERLRGAPRFDPAHQ